MLQDRSALLTQQYPDPAYRDARNSGEELRQIRHRIFEEHLEIVLSESQL